MTYAATLEKPAEYGLTDEEQKLSAEVRDFADTVVAPAAYEYDTKRELPYGIIAQMGEMGLFGLPFPREYGGRGKDYFQLCLAIEQLSRADQSIGVTLEAGVGLGMMPIYRNGSEEQRLRWLPDLTAGRALAGFGLTEADAGSDAAGTKTTARLEAGEWIIDGTKQFITNSGAKITSLVTVTAVTGETKRKDGSTKKELSAIIVPSGTTGFTVEPSYDKVGWHTSDTHPLTFRDVHVPEENLLGERGRGFANFLESLDEGRVAFAALCTGAAQGCLEESIKYAKTRNVFGHPIGDNQHISFKIARMQARVHAARLAYYDAARRIVAHQPFKMQASLAKLICSEAAMDNARDATQIFGGYGFLNESPVARHYRDSKILEIGEGTTEVQLMVISRERVLRVPGEHAELVLHFERGKLGAGAYPGKDAVDPHHTDVAVFGALQVSASGDLANEDGRDDLEGFDFIGGRVVVMMEHTDWRGRPRIVARCGLPVIGEQCVDRIITDLAIIEFEQKGDRPRSLVLRELAPGVSISTVVEATGAPLRIPPELVRPGSSL